MTAWVQVAGWTLVHFVWQGAAIAAVAAGGLRLLRSGTPTARYGVASVALGAMLVSPVLTAHFPSANLSTIIVPGMAPPTLPSSAVPAPAPRRDLTTSLGRQAGAAGGRLDTGLVLTVLVAVWLTGVALLLVRLAGGWWKVRRLHRTALALPESHWQTVASRLALWLRVRNVVHVVESLRVDTPTVLGWWHPVVLLPVAALANLTPDQVEAILAHELAHIRRHDYLVNLLQHVVETLLFYHPAVWWLSARMRQERELCCDAIALEVCRDPISYASALAQLETWRHERAPLAVAATEGALSQRIRLVLSVRPRHQRPLAHAVVTTTVVGLLMAMVGGGYRWPLVALGATGWHAQGSTVSPIPATGLVLTLNGEQITEADLEHFRPLHGEAANTPLPGVLVELVNERLVAERGKQLGYTVTDGEIQDALAYVKRQNKGQTDAQLQTQLATQHLTMADLRQHFERSILCFRVRQAEAFDRVEVTEDDARQYFESHLDEFPLQTFDLAKAALITRLKTAKLGQDLAPPLYLQSLRMTARMTWVRVEFARAYEEGLTQRVPPQGRADTLPVPPPQRGKTWQRYTTEHFDMFFTPDMNGQVDGVGREAERAYRHISNDLGRDLDVRPNLVLFATRADRDDSIVSGALPNAERQHRTLIALDERALRLSADLSHEITHAFEFSILSRFVANGSPLWILEGLSEYEAGAWGAGDQDALRELVRTNTVPQLSTLGASSFPAQARLHYSVGHAAFDFINARWGQDGMRRFLTALNGSGTGERQTLYTDAFDLTPDAFDESFEAYLRGQFQSAAAAAGTSPAFEGAPVKPNKSAREQHGNLSGGTTAGRTGTDSSSQLDSAELGSTLDVGDFCCPDYLRVMIQRIRDNWLKQTPGILCVPSAYACRGVVRFTIERDGTISTLMVEKPTGHKMLNAQALTAVRLLRRLPPLPAAFPKPRLTVHLGFAASAELATPLKLETRSKTLTLSDFTRDIATGKSEQVTVTGQKVSGTVTYDTFMQLDANERLETFGALTPVNQSALLREHLVRWQRLYADRLTPEQNQILEEAAMFNRPEDFERRRHSDETIKAFRSLSERFSRAFTTEEAFEVFTLRGASR